MGAPHKDGDALPDGERPACIPPGDYRVRFDRYETSILFGRAAKIRLHFTVVAGRSGWRPETIEAAERVRA